MSIAEEIAAGLSDAGTELGGGAFVSCLRKKVSGPTNPYDDTSATYEYSDITGLDFDRQVIDASGTLIQQTQRTLTLEATGAEPTQADTIAVGVASDDVTADTVWSVITEVRPLAPAGVALLYEVDLAAGGV
jgi:hypothetical protein